MTNSGRLRVLGIDPGVSETGWAVVEEGPALLGSGIIRTAAGLPLPDRLLTIHEGLLRVLREFRPDSVAVEEMFFLQAAHTVRATLQARGVVLLAARQGGCPVQEYNPRQVKMTLTGSGAAAKAQMQKMVQHALRLAEPLRPDDVADAAAIALCRLRQNRAKSLRVLGSIGGRGS
ncbi:MAG: crossover junction endodeoxyribonuclease RuvC [Elusimicrobiota bacterium]